MLNNGTIVVIAGQNQLQGAVKLPEQYNLPTTFEVEGQEVIMTAELLAKLYCSGVPLPKTQEDFVKAICWAGDNGYLNRQVHIVNANRLATKAGDSLTGYREEHMELCGWGGVDDKGIWNPMFSVNLSALLPKVFPAVVINGKECGRKFRKSFGSDKARAYWSVQTETSRGSITKGALATAKKADEEFRKANIAKDEFGAWDIYHKGLKDSEGKSILLPSIAVDKDALMILHIGEKVSKHGNTYYVSQAIHQPDTDKKRHGSLLILGQYYINHRYYQNRDFARDPNMAWFA